MAGAQRQEEAALRQLEVFWNDAAARRADEVAKRIKKHEAGRHLVKAQERGAEPQKRHQSETTAGGRATDAARRTTAGAERDRQPLKVRRSGLLTNSNSLLRMLRAARLSGAVPVAPDGGPAAPREVPRPVGDGQALGAGHSEVRDSHIDDKVVGKGYNRVPPAVQAFVTETLQSLKRHGLWGRLDGACTHAHTHTHPT